MSGPRRAWTLDSDAFERLLAFLDADRERGARRYEDIRRRLVKLFAWRGCGSPDDCADRTIDRVARRLAEGAEIRVSEVYQYFHGVAMNVLREQWRETAGAPGPLDDRAARAAVETDPDREAEQAARDMQLTCLESCLERLARPQRDLLLDYHGGDRHIERRRALAASLDIPLNALRIRVHRIRATVERCVTACVARGNPPVKHIAPARITQRRPDVASD